MNPPRDGTPSLSGSLICHALRQCRKAEGRTQVQVGEAADLLLKIAFNLDDVTVYGDGEF